METGKFGLKALRTTATSSLKLFGFRSRDPGELLHVLNYYLKSTPVSRRDDIILLLSNTFMS